MHFPPEGSKMKSKMFLLIPVFALAVCGVFAYSLLAQASDEIDIPFHKFVLNNGLTLIVHEDHKAPIVAVNVWYHVGSKKDRKSTRLNSSHRCISYAVFCWKKKKNKQQNRKPK